MGTFVALSIARSRVGEPRGGRDRAVNLGSQAQQTATVLRDVVYEVMPAPLIESGLNAALADLIDRIPMSVEFEGTAPDWRLPEVVESLAYFVVAESLTNAVKYAQASALSVRLRTSGQRFYLQISDNGVGGATVDPVHGLGSLQDRIEAIGGRCTVDSGHGGTVITAELPLQLSRRLDSEVVTSS